MPHSLKNAALPPIRQMMRACRKWKNDLKFADSTGVEMTGGRAFVASLIFRKVFHRLLGRDEKNVGLLMPTSVYGVLANLGLAMDRRTTVNLNYTFSIDTINDCIRKANVKHVVTSQKVLSRLCDLKPGLKIDAELIVMEEAAKRITLLDKITSLIDAYVTPIRALEWALGMDQIKMEDIITIIFTSGSTGVPKGAMITQKAIAENVRGFFSHLDLTREDRLLGSLPLFHSFGYTTTVWLPAMSYVGCAYHFNPLEPKKVGEMAKKYRCTAIPTTPTFLRSYLRRPKDEFEHANTVICGAEKLPSDLIDLWEEKFGFRPAEGYGTTELSPVVAVNVPKGRRDDYQSWLREGTIGRPLVNLEVRIVHPETGEVLPTDTPGILQVKGPSVMAGYYGEPKKTAEVLKDGWYSTGDMASLDKDGFIWITGRLSRMSKIGGEMVPHILVEEEIEKVLTVAAKSASEQAENDRLEVRVAVAGVPDAKKGERLVVLHRDLPLSPVEIVKALHAAGLPNLWTPTPHDFFHVESIPLLGTGKLDLRAVKDLALKMAAYATHG